MAFLAFAAVVIYQGELTVGRGGGPVITRAHDPEDFWRDVIVIIGVGCALLYASRFARPRRKADDDPARQAEPAEARPELPNYNPAFCARVVKAAGCVCAGLIVAELLVLLLVHPSDDRCPGWIFHPHQRSAVSLWALAGMFTVLPALWMCNIALRWERHYGRIAYDQFADDLLGGFFLNGNQLMLMVAVGWCLFCAIPLFLMLAQCTPIFYSLKTLHF